MNLEFQQIIRTLKISIKSRGYTYRQLAEEIGLSEAGLKRLLNAKDCSLQRLLQICKAIDISIEDLVAATSDIDEEIQHFTESQLALFSKSMLHLKYYYKLRVERLQASEIQKELGLTPGENRKILLDLDKVQLIRLQPDDVIENLGRRNVRWKALGKSLSNFKFQFTEDLIQHFKDESSESKDGHYRVYHLKLSEKSRQGLYQDLEKLIDQYARIGSQENIALLKKDIEPLNIAFILAPTTGFTRLWTETF